MKLLDNKLVDKAVGLFKRDSLLLIVIYGISVVSNIKDKWPKELPFNETITNGGSDSWIGVVISILTILFIMYLTIGIEDSNLDEREYLQILKANKIAFFFSTFFTMVIGALFLDPFVMSLFSVTILVYYIVRKIMLSSYLNHT